jgi:hypothetical protein
VNSPRAGCHWRVASEKCRHVVVIDEPVSSLKDRASNRSWSIRNAYSPRRAAPREKSINSHLENGHSVRYSDRMSTHCAAVAPTRYPPGEAHSLPAPAPLVTTFAAGPLSVTWASEVASRRLAALTIGTRRLLSSSLSLPATPQLQTAQRLLNCVAKNAFGDTIRHATESPRLGSATRHDATADQTDVLHHTPLPICRRQRNLPPVASLRTSTPQTTCELCRRKRISRQKSPSSSS